MRRRLWDIVTIMAAAIVLLLMMYAVGGIWQAVSAAPLQQPPIGWTGPATCTYVVDGDTVDVRIEHTLRLRLAECWSPEKKSDHRLPPEKKAAAKKAGIAAEKHMQDLVLGKRVMIHIPGSMSGTLSEILTLDRVVGYVWLKDHPEKTVNELQVEAGHATRTKEAL